MYYLKYTLFILIIIYFTLPTVKVENETYNQAVNHIEKLAGAFKLAQGGSEESTKIDDLQSKLQEVEDKLEKLSNKLNSSTD